MILILNRKLPPVSQRKKPESKTALRPGPDTRPGYLIHFFERTDFYGT